MIDTSIEALLTDRGAWLKGDSAALMGKAAILDGRIIPPEKLAYDRLGVELSGMWKEKAQ